MSEWQLVWLVPLRLVASFFFCFFYTIGGRGYKFCRRFIAPILFIGCCACISLILDSPIWKLWPLLALWIPLSLGYSNNDGWGWARRMIYGAAFGLVGIMMSYSYGVPILGFYQFSIAFSASCILGILNPVEAVNEEALISVLSVSMIPFMVR